MGAIPNIGERVIAGCGEGREGNRDGWDDDESDIGVGAVGGGGLIWI